jgi:hypothetical protein
MTAKRTFHRPPAAPLPTVEQIEPALDTLLAAIIKHDRTPSPPAPRPLSAIIDAADLMDTEFLPGEMFVQDPIRRSLREGVKQLGRTLFALTGSTEAMRNFCNRDHEDWQDRAIILDKAWDGIGDWAA